MLSLTQGDHKRLGINKSTLRYMQKHIKEGDRIKLNQISIQERVKLSKNGKLAHLYHKYKAQWSNKYRVIKYT